MATYSNSIYFLLPNTLDLTTDYLSMELDDFCRLALNTDNISPVASYSSRHCWIEHRLQRLLPNHLQARLLFLTRTNSCDAYKIFISPSDNSDTQRAIEEFISWSTNNLEKILNECEESFANENELLWTFNQGMAMSIPYEENEGDSIYSLYNFMGVLLKLLKNADARGCAIGGLSWA